MFLLNSIQGLCARKKYITSAVSIFLLLSSMGSKAELIISEIELTSTSLYFELSGEIDVVGETYTDTLFIGDVGNGSWILSGHLLGEWTSSGGTHQPTGAAVNPNTNPTAGHYVYTYGGGPISVGDTVDATFSLTGGSFDPEATDISTWFVSAGANSFVFPDPAVATGYSSSAPEPNSIIILMMAGILLCNRKRYRVIGSNRVN